MKQQTSEQLLQQIHEYIGNLSYMREPMGLYDPIEYVLGLGGKRLRPVLMLLAYNLYKEDVTRIFSQAAGIETYHNFTLLHDDLMDKADMRRNKPTVHKKWDENTAILSGDAMLILAYQFMMKECPLECVERVMEVFGRTALEVCEGQQGHGVRTSSGCDGRRVYRNDSSEDFRVACGSLENWCHLGRCSRKGCAVAL